MEIPTTPRNSKFLAAHRIFVVVTVLCLLALISAAPLLLSRASTVEATARPSGSAVQVDAQAPPSTTTPLHKLPKPPAGKRKTDRNIE
jgi:hypothetical protein